MKLSPLAAAVGIAGLVLWACARGWAGETGQVESANPSGEIPPDPAKIAADGERFLFVVETSSGNRRFEEPNRQAVFDLIVGGIDGQMRTGDTFGIWTFSDDVRAGDFPMTVWESERSLEIAGQAAAFLRQQKYSKAPDFKPLVGQLRQLADRVGDFNVLIISSGRERIVGTPFDQKINAAYDVYAKRPAKLARLPLVTGFIVRKGRPIRASVVLAGEKIILPERPPVAKTPARLAGNTNMSLATADPNGKPNTSATTPRKKVIQITTRSNPPSPSVATVTVPAPKPATNSSVASAAEPPAVSAPTSADARAMTAAAAAANSLDQLTNTPAPSLGNIAPMPLVSTPKAGAAPSESDFGFSVTSVSSLLSAAAEAAAAPPLRVAAREPDPSTPPRPSFGPEPASLGTSLPVTPAAAGIPAPERLGAGWMLAIGGTLLGAAGFLLLLVLRRPAHPPRGSLITQSMQRE